jgi:hypothetical protein
LAILAGMLGVEPELVSQPEDGLPSFKLRVNDAQRPLGLCGRFVRR